MEDERLPHVDDDGDGDAGGAATPPTMVPPEARLMFLTGGPGTGKSASVHALASELGLEVLTWDDSHVEYSHRRGNDDDDDGGTTIIPYASQLSSFEEFLTQGGAGMSSLDMLADDDDDEDDDTLPQRKKKKKNKKRQEEKTTTTTKGGDDFAGSLILVEEVRRFSFFSIAGKSCGESFLPVALSRRP